MSNSPLVDYVQISPNRTPNREHVIDTITIHCVVGQCTAESLGQHFSNPYLLASSNYGVDRDGRIGMYVEERDRSWCSSNSMNDARAVTIEVACEPTPPYEVNEVAYEALIQLVADICKRNGIRKLLWKADESLVGQVEKQNMTVHRWFDNKSCPGEWLYSRHGEIANRVNKLIDGSEWSKEARDWAVQTGLVVGYSDGNYGWVDPMTREQFVALLHRYHTKNSKGEL